jgi:ElaB/YqjD/DUF883 family membrane-anchored ribosome-binding protein
MAEKLHRSSDDANFDTYPAEPPQSGNRLRRENETALEERARQVGGAMGKAVATVRKAQDKVRNIAGGSDGGASLTETAKDKAKVAVARISDLADSAKSKAQEWSETAVSQADQLRQTTQEKTAELRSQIRSRYFRARIRANQVARDYPLHMVLAAGILGFAIGVGLRIWRANHES